MGKIPLILGALVLTLLLSSICVKATGTTFNVTDIADKGGGGFGWNYFNAYAYRLQEADFAYFEWDLRNLKNQTINSATMCLYHASGYSDVVTVHVVNSSTTYWAEDSGIRPNDGFNLGFDVTNSSPISTNSYVCFNVKDYIQIYANQSRDYGTLVLRKDSSGNSYPMGFRTKDSGPEPYLTINYSGSSNTTEEQGIPAYYTSHAISYYCSNSSTIPGSPIFCKTNSFYIPSGCVNITAQLFTNISDATYCSGQLTNLTQELPKQEDSTHGTIQNIWYPCQQSLINKTLYNSLLQPGDLVNGYALYYPYGNQTASIFNNVTITCNMLAPSMEFLFPTNTINYTWGTLESHTNYLTNTGGSDLVVQLTTPDATLLRFQVNITDHAVNYPGGAIMRACGYSGWDYPLKFWYKMITAGHTDCTQETYPAHTEYFITYDTSTSINFTLRAGETRAIPFFIAPELWGYSKSQVNLDQTLVLTAVSGSTYAYASYIFGHQPGPDYVNLGTCNNNGVCDCGESNSYCPVECPKQYQLGDCGNGIVDERCADGGCAVNNVTNKTTPTGPTSSPDTCVYMCDTSYAWLGTANSLGLIGIMIASIATIYGLSKVADGSIPIFGGALICCIITGLLAVNGIIWSWIGIVLIVIAGGFSVLLGKSMIGGG